MDSGTKNLWKRVCEKGTRLQHGANSFLFIWCQIFQWTYDYILEENKTRLTNVGGKEISHLRVENRAQFTDQRHRSETQTMESSGKADISVSTLPACSFTVTLKSGDEATDWTTICKNPLYFPCYSLHKLYINWGRGGVANQGGVRTWSPYIFLQELSFCGRNKLGPESKSSWKPIFGLFSTMQHLLK